MIRRSLYILLAGLAMACHAPRKAAKPSFSTIDYVTVGKMMDTIRPPYIIDVSHGAKRVVFIGSDHNRDTTHAQFGKITGYFNTLQPQLTFNEGGQIPDPLHFSTFNEAVTRKGYINGGDCRFCAIGRASKMVRDSILLNKIDNALNHYDRVMVTFGHGHAIALSPALQQIVDKHAER